MSKKPTTVYIHYLDGSVSPMECLYAKDRGGALAVARKDGSLFRVRYIPFSNPTIDYIEVESEKSEHEEGRD